MASQTPNTPSHNDDHLSWLACFDDLDTPANQIPASLNRVITGDVATFKKWGDDVRRQFSLFGRVSDLVSNPTASIHLTLD